MSEFSAQSFKNSFSANESPELLMAKLLQYGKENFQGLVEKEVTYNSFLNNNLKLLSLNLPLELNELLIDTTSAKYFWVTDSPLLSRYEEFVKTYSKGKNIVTTNQVEVKKFYLRWVAEKMDKEREYYALSTLQLIDRSTSGDNFIRLMLASIINIYDPKFFSLEKALDHITASKNILNSLTLNDSIKDEFNYYIKIFQGLTYLKIDEVEEANRIFNDALNDRNEAITAIFFSAITAKRLGNIEAVIELISRIINFDLNRFSYALTTNNLNLFLFALENASLYSIFREYDFAEILPEVRLIIDTSKSSDSNIFIKFSEWISKLKQLNFGEYLTPQITAELTFLERLSEAFKGSKNSFFLLINEQIVKKFMNVSLLLKERIKSVLHDKIKIEMEYFNEYLADEKKKIDKIKEELNGTKDRLIAKQKEAIEKLDEKAETSIKDVERKIKSVEGSTKFDPSQSFYNAMINNVIVAVIMVIIGGTIETLRQGKSSEGDISQIAPHFLKTGMVWGGIIFILGTIVCIAIAISTYFEGSREKKQLLKRITQLKNQKEKELNKIKKEFEKRLAQIEKANADRVKESEVHLESIRAEMNVKNSELQKSAETEIAATSKKLDEILS